MNISITTRLPLRDRFFDSFASAMIPVYQLMRKSRKPWHVQQQELKNYPPGSLGREVYDFLEANELTLIPRAEFHDVYHILFGFSTTMEDETAIQFVGVGNGKYSLPWLASCGLALAFYPERWEGFYKAYQKGRACVSFKNYDWQQYLNMQTEDIKRSLRKPM